MNKFCFTERTGFIGNVKGELEYSFNFIIITMTINEEHRLKRPVWLSIFRDYLDRYQAPIITSILEAIILLLLADTAVKC